LWAKFLAFFVLEHIMHYRHHIIFCQFIEHSTVKVRCNIFEINFYLTNVDTAT